MNEPAIIVLTANGQETAKRISAALPDAEIFVRRGRAIGGTAFDDTGEILRNLFTKGRTIIGVCAAGILIRLLAPVLNSKRDEPPVLAVSEDGAVVIPLLGGHRGGNRLAAELAETLGGQSAITTASDRRFGVALDDPPSGWVLSNPADANAFLAKLLDGAAVQLHGTADWVTNSDLPLSESGDLIIEVAETPTEGGPDHLVYHKRDLAIGIGCERDTSADEIRNLVTQVLTTNSLPREAIAGIWTIDLKMDEPGIADTATSFGVPLRFFGPDTLEAETPRLANPSEVVFREVGAHGVAEAAALAAAGAESTLIAPKVKSLRATCAVARADSPIEGHLGTGRGHLALVGLGPGQEAWRSGEAAQQLRDAEDIVGFKAYFDLIEDLPLSGDIHAFEIGAESDRVRKAFDLAATGRRVALICSGDAGIYAMAALAFEMLDETTRSDWRRISIEVAPGISALQAAAARIGAPLGHDFCTISLSDLLTPWSIIEKRIRAAAEGDFVVAFYNPVSKRRVTQLPAARDILLSHRPKNTPVVLARNLGRPDEAVRVISLGELSTDGVDMTTLVLVGSSETRRIDRGSEGVWVYTPRGYAAKQVEGTGE